ncbi:MAG TPA: hypothetical protein VHP34_10400 [Alphaproteobacteria bacterium]|nr:hypothetical protein [Alphaproteobacteria bacterium]
MQPNDYIQELNKQLSYLVSFSLSINELELVGATFSEFRGMQDAGWTTAITAHEVFSELQTLGARGAPLSKPEIRQVLCLYAQLSEAGGVYETLLNILRVVELKPYSMWPFQDMVRVRQMPLRVIGPNANAMFRRLAETAKSIGMKRLSELLEMTFRDDIRNGMFHADYILAHDGLRLRRRNGGHPEILTYDQVTEALQVALGFFQILSGHVHSIQSAYTPPRQIIGRFSAEPRPLLYIVESLQTGGVSISTSSAGIATDVVYERQQRINDKLGGKVFTAYATSTSSDVFTGLLDEIVSWGFDVQLIVLQSSEDIQALEQEIQTHDLWHQTSADNPTGGLLLATPFGFKRIQSIAEFQEVLPVVELVEFS